MLDMGGAWRGGDTGFPPGLAACSRIWGVYTPDVGTPLCVAAWLIFITAHNDGAREWGLGWKRQGGEKEGLEVGGYKIKEGREEIKRTAKRKNSASCS